MSIDAVRKLVEKPACGAVVGGISILLAASFIMSGSCRMAGLGGNGQQNGGQPKAPVVVTVGKFEVTEDDLNREKESMGMQGAVTPSQEASLTAFALRSRLDRGYALELAARKGVAISDEQMLKMLQKQIDDQLMQMKMQAQMAGRLKSGSDDEFDKFLKEQTGKTKAEYRTGLMDEFKTKALADPALKLKAEGDFVVPMLVEQATASIKPTDDDLKAQFLTFNMKKVFVRSLPDEKRAKETIDKAAAELKAGTPFETVMSRYSQDTPDPGKTVAETISKMNGASIQGDEGLKPILKLKAGEVSDVLKTQSGYGIYKVLSIDSTFKQADFDKQKADLAKTYASQTAQKQVLDEIDKLKKDNAIPIKWGSKGYELIYKWNQIPDQKLTQAEQTAKFEEIAKEAATATDTVSPKMLAIARYVAFTSVWNATPTDKRAAMIGERVESLAQVLQYTEGVDLRLEMVDALAEQKKGPEAAAALLEAARVNNDYDQKGQSFFNAINGKLLSLKEKGLLAAADEKSIEDEQTRWKNERAEKDKAEAERKKQDELDRKRAEEERKKAEAEQKKQASPTGTPSANPGSPAKDAGKAPASGQPLDLGGMGKK